MNVPNGKIVYTGMLNDKGGFESDMTVTRISKTEYMMVSPCAKVIQDIHWMRKHTNEDEFVTFTDVTSSTAVLGVMGPESAKILEMVGPDGVNLCNDEDFPFGTSKTFGIGSV
jgi:glycine cleavage system aminomethyltransferase T